MPEYIHCSCHRKYINSDESIVINFGFNRLNERYRTCVKCRQSGKGSRDKKILLDPDYADTKRERNKQWYIDNKEQNAMMSKIYDENTERLMAKS